VSDFWKNAVECIRERTLCQLKPRVTDITLGLAYSGMLLEDTVLGLSYTAFPRSPKRQIHPKWAGNLQATPIDQLLEFFTSEDQLERTIGLTCVNALSQFSLREEIGGRGGEDLPENREDVLGRVVGMIGEIRPLVARITKAGGSVFVIDREREVAPRKGVTPVQELSDLDQLDHLFVSGTAMLYDDFSEVIKLKTRGSKALVGPSAQILPSIAFQCGFDVVASSYVCSPTEALRILREGGGYFFMKRFCKKYTFYKNENM